MSELQKQALAAQAIINQLIDAGEDDQELIADMVDGETEFLPIMDKVLSRYREAVFMEKAAAERIKELQERKGRLVRKQESIKAAMLGAMTLAGMTKLPLTEATLSRGASRQSLVIVDESALPDEFVRIKREPDKVAIEKAAAIQREIRRTIESEVKAGKLKDQSEITARMFDLATIKGIKIKPVKPNSMLPALQSDGMSDEAFNETLKKYGK